MLAGWYCLGEAREEGGREGVPGRSRFHLQQAVPGVTPGHHTPPPPPPVLFLQHNLISYIQQEFLRKIFRSTSDGEISGDEGHHSGKRDSLVSIVGTWAGSRVNLIKYQPGLSFLCDTNAY